MNFFFNFFPICTTFCLKHEYCKILSEGHDSVIVPDSSIGHFIEMAGKDDAKPSIEIDQIDFWRRYSIEVKDKPAVAIVSVPDIFILGHE